MNKREAQRLSDKGGYTVRYLRSVIASARGTRAESRVNKAIPFERALDIYEGALHGRDDDETIVPWTPDVYSRTDKMNRTKGNLIVRNILWDCLS